MKTFSVGQKVRLTEAGAGAFNYPWEYEGEEGPYKSGTTALIDVIESPNIDGFPYRIVMDGELLWLGHGDIEVIDEDAV